MVPRQLYAPVCNKLAHLKIFMGALLLSLFPKVGNLGGVDKSYFG
jgi:hypothetical protein